MNERFSDHLHQLAEPIWQAQHAHPFVCGIGAGTLDLDRFAYWVRQDYLFLGDYARLYMLIAARAPDLELMTRFVTLAQSTLQTEMELHRVFAAQFGITPQALQAEQPSPTILAYTNFLLRTALLSSYGESLAALLPCMWAFCEIGQRLAAQDSPGDQRYAKWIAMYSSPEFVQLTNWCREMVESAAAGLPASELKRMEDAFLISSRYEYLFWEAAWQQEQWTV